MKITGNIMKTRLYNIDPLKPHFLIVKLGFTGVYITFLIILNFNANSVDPDRTPHFAASDLGLHCLPSTHFGVVGGGGGGGGRRGGGGND